MPKMISDEMLHAYAIVHAYAIEAAPDEIGHVLKERYEGLTDRVALYVPFMPGERDGFWRATIDAVRQTG